jgi:lantibiotic modifying enzyme
MVVECPSLTRRARAVHQIARRASDNAFTHQGRSTWLGAEPSDHELGRPRTFASLGPDLYAGTSGVSLFLLSCSSFRHVDTALLAANALRQSVFLMDALALPSPLGLYTGIPGVLLALKVAHQVAHDPETIDWCNAQIARLIDEVTQILKEPTKEFDLISGLAGSILGLLAVRDCQGQRALDPAERASEMLLALATEEGDDLAWHSASRPRDLPPTGLSHGASGPALAFAELAGVTGNARWADAAHAAFSYERRWFSASKRNWPDLRNIRSVARRQHLPYSVKWCHGSAGMGLARFYAGKILNDEQLREEGHDALDMTARWLEDHMFVPGVDMTLCHGICGNADILLTSAQLAGDAQWRVTAEHVASAVADEVLDTEPSAALWSSPGLMLGWSGVGMFLIRSQNLSLGSPLHPVQWC